jgi:hypothetical protein
MTICRRREGNGLTWFIASASLGMLSQLQVIHIDALIESSIAKT